MAATSDPDLPPSFPSSNSAQRQSSSQPPRSQSISLPNSNLKARLQPATISFTVSGPSSSQSHQRKAQKLRSVSFDDAGDNSGGSLSATPPCSSASLLPPSTSRLTAPVGVGGATDATLLPTSRQHESLIAAATAASSRKRNKVVLRPGHSPLDWARLKNTIRPPFPFKPIPLSEVKMHNSRESAWTVFHGKVYDIGPYLDFHPGGVDELMRVAGRDGTRLFSK